MTATKTTRLVASTHDDYNRLDVQPPNHDFHSDSDSSSTSEGNDRNALSSLDTRNFRSLFWSADGTSLITSSADRTLRTFILPPDLLESPALDTKHAKAPESHHLTPYSSHLHPSPTHAVAISPYYNITAPETTLILTSPSSLPIRLTSPFAAGILATYPLVNPSTEKWETPHSLLFSVHYNMQTPDGYMTGSSLRFLAGSQNQISLFDVSRNGEGPTTTLCTAPGNRKSRRGGTNGMAGIVSAMAISCDGILAAGTFSRGVGLYDSQGMGDTIGAWSLTGNEDGSGVTSLHWSNCGRYLVIAERQSDTLGVWDIRGTGQKLAWLSGRNAVTPQRLGVTLGNDIGSHGSESVYAGGVDGHVRVWHGLGMKEGFVDCDWQWKAHGDVISGLAVHDCGTVIATCSGSRSSTDHERTGGALSPSGSQSGSDDDSVIQVNTNEQDNSIKVWSLE